jgi:hypothetical protein
VPIRLIVPGVRVVELADDFVADAVGIKRRTVEKRNNSARLFFMKGEASLSFEYNSSEHNTLQGDVETYYSCRNNCAFSRIILDKLSARTGRQLPRVRLELDSILHTIATDFETASSFSSFTRHPPSKREGSY